MEVLKKYGLSIVNTYYKPQIIFGKEVTDLYYLKFINIINKHECESLLFDMNESLRKGRNIDEGFVSDGVEYMHYGILYQYPNVLIEDTLIIPMVDLKEILEEVLKYY